MWRKKVYDVWTMTFITLYLYLLSYLSLLATISSVSLPLRYLLLLWLCGGFSLLCIFLAVGSGCCCIRTLIIVLISAFQYYSIIEIGRFNSFINKLILIYIAALVSLYANPPNSHSNFEYCFFQPHPYLLLHDRVLSVSLPCCCVALWVRCYLDAVC